MRPCSPRARRAEQSFPFLLGGTFIEAADEIQANIAALHFPFLLGGTFIEAEKEQTCSSSSPTFSLPFGRDFH